jgi:hypothetical protein
MMRPITSHKARFLKKGFTRMLLNHDPRKVPISQAFVP